MSQSLMGSMEGAAKYTLESIDNCRQLAQFIKKRQIIEEEYARSLRKLCKSISLIPLQKNASSGSYFCVGKKGEATAAAEDPSKTTLWSTFFEIVDDTAQVAKSHTAFAESLQHQLFESLNNSIKEMEAHRSALVEEGHNLSKELSDANSVLKKTRKEFEASSRLLAESRNQAERLGHRANLLQTPKATKEFEKAITKSRAAEERFRDARMNHRQQEETVKNLQSKFEALEIPRIIQKLQQQEAQRGREAMSHILCLTELERRCAVMNENFAAELTAKLKNINLNEDDRRFNRAFSCSVELSAPATPQKLLPPQQSNAGLMAPVSNVGLASASVQFPSMPPAYDQDPGPIMAAIEIPPPNISDTCYGHLNLNASGSIGFGSRSRQLTVEL